MRAYTIFDDFPESAVEYLQNAGIQVTIHPKGLERPDELGLKNLVETYDILIVGTGQAMPESVFQNVNKPCIIGTASIGTDHIRIPKTKKDLVKVVNAPKSNCISVAEHTFALLLALDKYLPDAISVAEHGKKKEEMQFIPSDLYGEIIGVVGAGGTASVILKMARSFGMTCFCWTPHPEKHNDIQGVEFLDLDDLMRNSDIVSINIPLKSTTKGLIDRPKIDLMKPDAIFISVSRAEITDNKSLFDKARINPQFRIGLDVDADEVYGMWDIDMKNVIVTPHIAGGTKQSRNRMFIEVSKNIAELCSLSE